MGFAARFATPLASFPLLVRALLASLLLATPGAAMAAPASPPEITWDDLIPPDWNPRKEVEEIMSQAYGPDSSPETQAVYARLRKLWDEAPLNDKLAGRAVRIPGYIVPLEQGKSGIREFLLVPYFGACIHTPPPPANQIIHVKAAKPAAGVQSMSAVWVEGTLAVQRAGSSMGVSGYTLAATKVEKFVPPADRDGARR